MPRSSPRPSYNFNNNSPQQSSESSPLRTQLNRKQTPSTPTKTGNTPTSSPRSRRGNNDNSNNDLTCTRLVSYLSEHHRLRKQWHRLVLTKGSDIGSDIIRIREEKSQTLSSNFEKSITSNDKETTKEAYELKMTSNLEDYAVLLAQVLFEIEKLHSRLLEIDRQINQLLLNYSQEEGINAAFLKPLWNTWSLSHFANAIESLTPHYTNSLHLLHDLFNVLTDHSSTIEQCQAALSYWVCQPLLPRPSSTESSKCLEEICDVEIPTWSSSS